MFRLPIRVALLVAMVFLAVSFFLKGQNDLASLADVLAQQPDSAIQKLKTDLDVVDEAPDPSDSAEQIQRDAKNRYYNMGDRDLLTLEPGLSVSVIGCGAAMPLLPTEYTPIIVLGTVLGGQPYLSENHSAVYTEYSFHIEEFLNNDNGYLPMSGENLVVDRGGGALRHRSGKVIRYDMSGSAMARPLQIRERCILFLNRVNDGFYLNLGPGFLLRDGKAYLM